MAIPIPTPSLKELKEYFDALLAKWKWYKQQKKIRAAQAGRHDKRLAAVLTQLYPDAVHPYNDPAYPVALFPVSQSQQDAPDSILGTLKTDPVPVDVYLQKAGQSYVNLLQALGRPLEDLPVYCLSCLQIRSDGLIKIDCGMGTYFDTIRTCDALGWELLTTLGTSQTYQIKALVKRLKLRNYVHHLSRDPLRDPAGRSAAIGISTVVMFNRGHDYGVILARRSSQGVAVNEDLYHVAPSAMFQPAVGDQNDFSVVHNTYREYLEELFGLKEAKKAPAVLSYDYFYNNPNLRFLRDLITRGDASFLLTGIAVDLLNLRPEICTLIRIETPEWFEKHRVGADGLSRIQLNDEFSAGLSAVSLSRVKIAGIRAEDLAPPAGAALYLALQVAKARGWL
jgi:hypothetical protein